jgi:aminodeoxyfutalosine synthase
LTSNNRTFNLLTHISGGTPALEKALAGEELSYEDGVQLMNDENLFLLGSVADRIR